jgi:8-oxo-dGTP pyrophosphatase MutT (NUDIX family)
MKQAVVALIIKNGLILGITRRNDKTKYGLIGGKVDPDETLEQALYREVKEETGIKVNSCVEIYKRIEVGDGPTGEDYHSTCFYATDWSGDPTNSEEGNVAWLTVEEICSTKAAFGDYNTKTFEVFKTMFPDVFLFNEGV